MNRRPRKTHDQYLQERIERDPELAAVYKEALLETKLAFDLANFREHQGITQREWPQRLVSRSPGSADWNTLWRSPQ
jgi:hypothetical protein